MLNVTIAVINQSTLVTDDELMRVSLAINRVSMPPFAARWGASAILTPTRQAGDWLMFVQDSIGAPGDLAYHVFQNGLPQIRVDAGAIRRSGASLAQAIDHEVKEALADPTAAQTVALPGGAGIIVKEVCDPVSGDGLDLGGGLIGANFVYPNWFEEGSTGPWDERGLCAAAFDVRPGGYKEELPTGSNQWELTALRDTTGLLSWRLGHHGRLAYRAWNR